MAEPTSAARSSRDRTPWPDTDGDGNSLKHSELCAWRFGGECDCEPNANTEAAQ